MDGVFNPLSTLTIKGSVNINNGTQYVGSNNYMMSGSLTIGDITENYGTGGNNWSTNTAGLMMECLDNTEIMVHDSFDRLTSLIQYNGGTTNTIYMDVICIGDIRKGIILMLKMFLMFI